MLSGEGVLATGEQSYNFLWGWSSRARGSGRLMLSLVCGGSLVKDLVLEVSLMPFSRLSLIDWWVGLSMDWEELALRMRGVQQEWESITVSSAWAALRSGSCMVFLIYFILLPGDEEGEVAGIGVRRAGDKGGISVAEGILDRNSMILSMDCYQQMQTLRSIQTHFINDQPLPHFLTASLDYSPIHIFKFAVNQPMSRQRQPVLKRPSKDKPKRDKPREQSSNGKFKGSSLKAGKLHSSSQQKGKGQVKRKPAKNTILQSNPINMKKDLKMLLGKNTLGRSKLSVAVPDILKKIEENCRALKKIDGQHDPSQKKSSKHNSRESKSFKHSAINSRSELNPKHFTRSKQGQEPVGILKNNRYSYELEKERREQRAGKNEHRGKNDPFQEYRKCLQNEELRIEKSSKNTNYNTNQSRNSSSLHNSHGISNVLESMAKNRRIEERFTKFEKVQSLIKNQQVYFQRGRERRSIEVEVEQPQRPVEKEKKIYDLKDFEINDVFIRSTNGREAQAPKKEKEEAPLNHHFERSKYYVQPIPAFKRRTEEGKLQDSLLGCEITLIENNIIDDSELPDLQL